MDQVAGVDRWSRQMARELSYLPDTLAQFREGVGNFQRVTKRLADATETIELVNQIPSGALRAMRDQLVGAPGGSVVSGALGDLSGALASAVRLNPLWPRDSGSRPSESPGEPEPTGSAEPTGRPEDDA